MKNTSFLSLGLHDLLKGFLLSVLTVVISGVGTYLNAGTFPDESALKSIGLTGLAAGSAYLLKNLFTNSNDKFLTKEPKL